MKDNFYAVNMSQDQWDQIFGKKLETHKNSIPPEWLEGPSKSLKEFIDAQGLELIAQAQRDIAKSVAIPKELTENKNENS
jgi:hypothetical protein